MFHDIIIVKVSIEVILLMVVHNYSHTMYVLFVITFPLYDFNDAVIITSILIVNKEICIYAGDDETYIKSLVSNGQKHNKKIKCHRVE